jgi:hypothetical protein
LATENIDWSGKIKGKSELRRRLARMEQRRDEVEGQH